MTSSTAKQLPYKDQTPLFLRNSIWFFILSQESYKTSNLVIQISWWKNFKFGKKNQNNTSNQLYVISTHHSCTHIRCDTCLTMLIYEQIPRFWPRMKCWSVLRIPMTKCRGLGMGISGIIVSEQHRTAIVVELAQRQFQVEPQQDNAAPPQSSLRDLAFWVFDLRP